LVMKLFVKCILCGKEYAIDEQYAGKGGERIVLIAPHCCKETKEEIVEKTFSMLEVWEKSKVYGRDDARNQRGEAVMELFQMLKKYDEGRYLYIKDKYWKES